MTPILFSLLRYWGTRLGNHTPFPEGETSDDVDRAANRWPRIETMRNSYLMGTCTCEFDADAGTWVVRHRILGEFTVTEQEAAYIIHGHPVYQDYLPPEI